MKTPLTFILSLTFLFLFSGSSSAGIFSPDDYYECIFNNMKHAKNRLSVFTTLRACKSKFPNTSKKATPDMFEPDNYNDCVLKHNKGVENGYASLEIQQACSQKFKAKLPVEGEGQTDKSSETGTSSHPVEGEGQTDTSSETWNPPVFGQSFQNENKNNNLLP